MINLKLAAERGIDNTDIVQIQTLHTQRADIVKSMKGIQPLTDGKLVYTVGEYDYLQYCGDYLGILEAEIQRLWGWEADASMTKFWLLPHCTCPVLDNEDRMGCNAGSIINGECPVHGNKGV